MSNPRDVILEDAFGKLPGALRAPLAHDFTAAVRRRRRRRAAALSVAVASAASCVVAVVVGATVRDQAPPTQIADARPASTSKGLTMDEQRWQQEIRDYKRALVGTAEAHSNYAGVSVDPANRSLHLFGTGTAPSDVVDELAKAPANLHADWRQVPYSRTDLSLAAKSVEAVIPQAVDVTVANDYAGLAVGLTNVPTETELLQLQDRARRATEVPVTFVRSGGVSADLPTR